jgi:hypothetical protein
MPKNRSFAEAFCHRPCSPVPEPAGEPVGEPAGVKPVGVKPAVSPEQLLDSGRRQDMMRDGWQVPPILIVPGSGGMVVHPLCSSSSVPRAFSALMTALSLAEF